MMMKKKIVKKTLDKDEFEEVLEDFAMVDKGGVSSIDINHDLFSSIDESSHFYFVTIIEKKESEENAEIITKLAGKELVAALSEHFDTFSELEEIRYNSKVERYQCRFLEYKKSPSKVGEKLWNAINTALVAIAIIGIATFTYLALV